ncbi:GL14154, partial [Drosophila persimilis]
GPAAWDAVCSVINHTPLCACIDGYIGNPFTKCSPKPPEPTSPPPVADDPCNPSPCGSNAVCRNGQCSCIPEYQGDPYVSCRPESVLNTDCPRDRACVRNKCIDPCPGTCGVNALCEVTNHIPICRCPDRTSGNAFFECRPVPAKPIIQQNPCQPTPCGPNSQCRVVQNTAVCSCLKDYVGSPPQCRPECVTNSDCPADQSCQNMKCRDPCPGTCGFNALCNVVNHSPFCSCPTGMSGNPFVSCQQLPQRDDRPQNPCQPSPCGPNSECRVSGDSPSCSCLPEFVGAPPNCKPECISSSECPTNRACINQKCVDPCPGLCGQNANCRVFSHTAMCLCESGFTGHPFTQCSPVRDAAEEVLQPCNPSPCGVNHKGEERGGARSCTFLPE